MAILERKRNADYHSVTTGYVTNSECHDYLICITGYENKY
jgi:hypothetical protein